MISQFLSTQWQEAGDVCSSVVSSRKRSFSLVKKKLFLMSSISASLDPSEEARLLSDHPSHHHHHHPHHQHAHILSSAEEYSDLESEYEEEEESDPDGFLRSNQRIFFLLLEALFALIIRLWLATVSVSLLMYILRRMSMHSLVHQSGSLMSDAEVEVSIFGKHTQYRHHLPATPSLFGEIISAPIVGTNLCLRSTLSSTITALTLTFSVNFAFRSSLSRTTRSLPRIHNQPSSPHLGRYRATSREF